MDQEEIAPGTVLDRGAEAEVISGSSWTWLPKQLSRILDSDRWKFRALLLVLTLSLVRAFPSYDALGSDFVRAKWQAAQMKVDHPLLDNSRVFPRGTHENNLALRLTVPLVADLLRLPPLGVLLLTGLAGVLLLARVLDIVYGLIGDRMGSFLVCLTVACVWPGLAAFHELRGGYYDAVALCFLLGAFNPSTPFVAGLCTFAAAWTDERAVPASAFAIVFHLAQTEARGRLARLSAIVAALFLYASTRLLLVHTHHYNFHSDGLGLPVFLTQVNILWLGIWTGLGGGWLLTIGGVIAFIRVQRFLLAAVFGAAIAMMAGGALLTIDVTRGMAFCLPAVFVGLVGLKTTLSSHALAGLLWTVSTISLLVPTHYVEGAQGVWWLYPLPVQIVRWLVS